MSSRQLRKIRQQQELLRAATPTEEDASVESEEEELVAPVKPRVSMFAALGGDDDENDENEADNYTKEQEETLEENEKQVTAQSAATSKKSKKKKKKGKKKQGGDNAVAATLDPNEDEIDRALKELNIQPRASKTGATSSSGGEVYEHEGLRQAKVLEIDPYNLKAIHEMKNLFGREVIEAARAEDEAEAAAARRRLLQGGAQRQVDLETFLRGDPGRKLPEITLRRNMFIQGKDYWPRATAGGLVMKEMANDPEGVWTEYAFVHEKQYDVIQTIFFHCVGLGDPMRMVYLLKQFPYHISTLLQVSSFAKQDQNQALAADLCERALFTFGRATLSTFRTNLEKGRARLDFRRPENRQFWLAGYHYLKSLMRKGTYRTALEWAKLILSLDPADPYGMNHLIHILAIRGHESNWLESYMGAFAQGSLHGEIRYYRNTLVLGLLQEQEDAKAKAQLITEIEAMPWLYCALFQALNLDAPPAIWGVQPPSEVDAFYTKLYIEMTKDLWNYPRSTSLLKDAANIAKKQETLKATDAVLELRTARFVYLEGNTTMLGLVPRHYLERQPNYEFDPLPPDKSANIFTASGVKLPFTNGDDESPEARNWLRNLLPREAPRGDTGGAGGDMDEMAMNEAAIAQAFDLDDYTEEELEGLEDDDATLGPEDLNQPSVQESIYNRLVDLFRGRRSAAEPDGDGDVGDTAATSSGLPGAWPTDEADDDAARGAGDGEQQPQADGQAR
ncbi:hypothetical protein jhhlp_002177 [Lomentospora prolificans]|uniref:Uncharacterized protein n=1 Tax=Lomentospora prolificans TaxID=41688 RepID=A0A2N3ND89_9PEZI|nr:hypothetical protein jhhlp_002177 [Lomentospora prolificans]